MNIRSKQGRNKIAEVSKKWLSLTDTYGVEIDPGQNDILILAVAIAIDMMAHDDDDKKPKRSKSREYTIETSSLISGLVSFLFQRL